MSRTRLVAAAATVAALVGAWALWQASPAAIARAGLGRYDLLARVLLVFAGLGLAEAIANRVALGLFPDPQGHDEDSPDEH